MSMEAWCKERGKGGILGVLEAIDSSKPCHKTGARVCLLITIVTNLAILKQAN